MMIQCSKTWKEGKWRILTNKKDVFPSEGSQLFLRCAPFCSVLLFEHNCLGIRGLDISPKVSWITVEICMPFQYNYAFYRMYSIHISKRNIWLTKVLRNLVSRMCTLDRCQHPQDWVQLYFSRWSTVFTRFWFGGLTHLLVLRFPNAHAAAVLNIQEFGYSKAKDRRVREGETMPWAIQ